MSYIDNKAVALGSDEVPEKEKSFKEVILIRLSEDNSAVWGLWKVYPGGIYRYSPYVLFAVLRNVPLVSMPIASTNISSRSLHESVRHWIGSDYFFLHYVKSSVLVFLDIGFCLRPQMKAGDRG